MKRILLTLCLCIALLFSFSAVACAAEPSIEAAQTDAGEVQDTAEEGFFLLLYRRLGAHLPELFSALSLLAACIIGICYKRGLLPILRDGLGAIGAATKDYGKAAEDCAEQTRIICENANNNIHFAKELAEKTSESLIVIEKRLDALGDQKSESERLRLLMSGQVEMLRDIFLSSALPQFEKDRVCKRVEEMKAALQRSDRGDGDAEA